MREAGGNKPDMMSEHEQNVKGLITIQLNNLIIAASIVKLMSYVCNHSYDWPKVG